MIGSIIEYLNDVGANSEDEIGIPLAIRYNDKSSFEIF